ncbi:MAG TPA: thioredoxin domain-containing protein [Terriglobales bacterium]
MKRIAALMLGATMVVSVGMAQQKKTTAKPASTKPAVKTTAAPAEPKKEEAVPGTEAKLPDEATVLAFYNRMFGFQQNLNFKVADIRWSDVPGIAEVTAIASTPEGQQVAKLFVTPDGKHAVSGEMIPFGRDPFADNRELLKNAFGPVRGSAMPEITLVEFADLQCPACKAAQPTIEKLLSDEPKARLVFQSFPLEELHPWALQAASYLDCISRTNNDGALTFMDAVFTHQGEITKENAPEKLKSYVEMAKGDPAKISACAVTPETQARIQKSIELGHKVKVTGTPTLFVNGRPISNLGGIPYDTLKALVEFESNQK